MIEEYIWKDHGRPVKWFYEREGSISRKLPGESRMCYYKAIKEGCIKDQGLERLIDHHRIGCEQCSGWDIKRECYSE